MQRKRNCLHKVSIKTNNRTSMGLSRLQPLQYIMCSIKPPVILAALCWIHSSLSVSIWGHLSMSRTGHITPAIFSKPLGRGELSLHQPVGYNLAVNTAQFVFGFFTIRTSFCLMFHLCPPQPPPPPKFIPALFCKAAH